MVNFGAASEQFIGSRSVAGTQWWVLQFQCIFLGGSALASLVETASAFGAATSSGLAAGASSGAAGFGSAYTNPPATDGRDEEALLNGGDQA